MKWTNPGHELDEIGSGFLKVKNICLFGFDEQSSDMLNFLKWIDIEKDFNSYKKTFRKSKKSI